jgi:tetratricopeptide (TPR) repeat protein
MGGAVTDPAIGPDEGVRAASVGNVLSGRVEGPSVQAGSIHGGVTVHVHHAESRGATPRELPARSAVFVNQRVILETLSGLRRSFRDDVVPVLALTGPGGVGKTAVAVEWLTGERHEFPDGELYADLGGSSLAAPEPEKVLVRFLVELGVAPRRVPLELAALAAMFRSVTARRRVAVLLDNPVSFTQFRHLLPGSAASTVVITSRWRFDWLAGLAGARIVDVEPLDAGASMELLARLVPDGRVAGDASSARRLAAMCDGLPLALRIVGGSMAVQRSRSAARVVERLADERTRLASLTARGDLSVRAVFDASYEDLPVSVARLYRLLSVHPGRSFTVDVAAAAGGMGFEEAADALDLLSSASLVREVAAERYGFHDLVRLHAAARAGEEDRPEDLAAAFEWMLLWYLRRTVAADLALMPGRWRLNGDYDDLHGREDGPDTEAAWAWLEAERENLVACVLAAVERGFDDLAWKLCEAMWSLLFRRGYHHDWVTTHEQGVVAARRLGDRRAEARMRCQLGLAYQEINQLEDAGEQFTAAYAADVDAGHLRGQATARELLGLLEHRRARYDAAIELFTSALSLNGDPRAAGILWRHLGAAQLGAGRIDGAFQSLDRARASLAELEPPDRYNETRTETIRAKVLLRQGRPDAALATLTEALVLMRAERARVQEADIHADLAEVHLALGERVEAALAARRALALYEELDTWPDQEIHARLEAIAVDTADGSG